MSTAPEKEKKSRFGGLLRKKQDKDQRPNTLPDSAYGSSDAPSGNASAPNDSQVSDISQLDNDQKLEAIEKDDNLSVKPGTNDVVDRETGQVVTTVTTTTTTTTTTTVTGANGQKKGEPEVKEEVKQEVQRNSPGAAAGSNRDSAAIPELSGNPTPPESGATVSGPSPTTYEEQPTTKYSPPIPPKSAMRKSTEVPAGSGPPETDSPVSPSLAAAHSNFSYPRRQSRGASGVGEDEVRYRSEKPPGTLQNLKAAAAGIHGAGETLRGTFNSNIDKRFPMSKDAERNAQLSAKHEAVIAAGKSEIDSGQLAHQRRKEQEMQRQREIEIEAEEKEEKKSRGGLSGLLRRKPVASEGEGGSEYKPPTGTDVRRHY